MIILIGIKLNYQLINYGKDLIYEYLRKSMNQDFINLDEAILWKLKCIVLYEGLHIESHINDKVSWYNIMAYGRKGETTTKYLTITIGGDTVTYYLYASDG